jgi:hypothetical protein
MSSVKRSARITSLDNGFYIPVGNLTGLIYALNTTTGAQTFSTASWANFGSRYLSSVVPTSGGAGILKDVGRTYVSAGRTFRKVQLVVPQSTGTVSTFGVNGQTGTLPLQDFLEGYIEVGFEGQAVGGPTPVAKFGI